MSVEPAAGSNLGPDCQRPAGWGSHTREISVSISSSPTHLNYSHFGIEGALVQNINLPLGRFRLCNGWCGLWVFFIKCTLFVVAIFEEGENATVCTAVDATLHHADSHPVHCLKYVHFRNVAVCLQPRIKKHLSGTSEKKGIAVVIFSFPQTINSCSTCANKCPVNAAIILSCRNLSLWCSNKSKDMSSSMAFICLMNAFEEETD